MRIAGGILILLLGIWNLGAGGCQLACGGVASKAGDLTVQIGQSAQPAMNQQATQKEAQNTKLIENAGVKIGAVGAGLVISGGFILLSGLLCFIGGLLCLMNQAKVFCIMAPAVAILGEILSLALVGFSMVAFIVKILIAGFGILGATKISADTYK